MTSKKPGLTWDNLSSRILARLGLEIPVHCRVPECFIVAAVAVGAIAAIFQPKGGGLVFSIIIFALLTFIGAILADGRLKED